MTSGATEHRSETTVADLEARVADLEARVADLEARGDELETDASIAEGDRADQWFSLEGELRAVWTAIGRTPDDPSILDT